MRDDIKIKLYEFSKDMNMKEVDYFLEQFMPAYSLTLDEQSKNK